MTAEREGYEPDMERDRNTTPGPQRPGTRRIVAWVLILALVSAFPLSYLIGSAQTSGGSQIVVALVVVAALVGGVAFWLHRRTGP